MSTNAHYLQLCHRVYVNISFNLSKTNVNLTMLNLYFLLVLAKINSNLAIINSPKLKPLHVLKQKTSFECTNTWDNYESFQTFQWLILSLHLSCSCDGSMKEHTWRWKRLASKKFIKTELSHFIPQKASVSLSAQVSWLRIFLNSIIELMFPTLHFFLVKVIIHVQQVASIT